ncbi:MAG: plasmid pRiA4b ORF-3 family protein [Deltaproteobacteria bacterium]|nr:plasmid pRiA4b ORF-3 family protein [Deltaproteobacteria bacterium]
MTKKKQVQVISDKKIMGLDGHYAVDFHISIIGTDPLVWRKVRLSNHMTLNDLHWAIQGAFGWENAHLHAFYVNTGRISGNEMDDLDDPDGDENTDSNGISIHDLIEQREKKFTYEYDFGDSWHHEIKIVGTEPLETPMKVPECIDGERCCPPEDCGGVWGFENFLEVMADPSHEEYADMKDWYGRRFNAEKFSIADANKEIKSFLRHA